MPRIWRRPWPSLKAPTKGSTFHINIEDECTASWTPINNTFTRIGNESWPRTTRLWNGVLIQIGEYINTTRKARIKEFKSITFHRGNLLLGTISAHEYNKNLYWINVARKEANATDPMTADDLCCLRIAYPGHTFHRWFRSYWGGITFWNRTSNEGWNLAATRNNGLHYKFHFTLTRTSHFEVKVYKNGAEDRDLSKSADTIKINFKSGGNHGDQVSPPQYPPQQQT